MRTLLLALILTLLATTANAHDTLLQLYRESKQVQASVEQHPKAHEPVAVDKIQYLMPPHVALKTLRGNAYTSWALLWNKYHDEQAARLRKQRVFYGSTTTTNGAVTTSVPRFWIYQEGIPGVIRYNPFVELK
jgi:hypothetical protein